MPAAAWLSAGAGAGPWAENFMRLSLIVDAIVIQLFAVVFKKRKRHNGTISS